MSELYLLTFDAPLPDTLRPVFLARISSEKRARLQSMRSDTAMTQSLLGDLLARVLACGFLRLPNTALRFSSEAGGKPHLVGETGFHFNISHTSGAIALAIAREPVGVDVERLDRHWEPRVVKRFFTPDEAAYITLAESGQDARFFEVWTRKEAFLKQSGLGLSAPLSSLPVLVGENASRLRTYYRAGLVLSLCCGEEAKEIEAVSWDVFCRRVAELDEIL